MHLYPLHTNILASVPPHITYSIDYISYKKNVAMYLKLVTDIFCVLKKPVYAINLHCIHLEWLRFPPRAA